MIFFDFFIYTHCITKLLEKLLKSFLKPVNEKTILKKVHENIIFLFNTLLSN